jgi:hypothetical protein
MLACRCLCLMAQTADTFYTMPSHFFAAESEYAFLLLTKKNIWLTKNLQNHSLPDQNRKKVFID